MLLASFAEFIAQQVKRHALIFFEKHWDFDTLLK